MEKRNIPVIACELPEEEQRRCAEAYRSGLFAQVQEVRESQAGYSLRFVWESERIRKLGDFLAVDSGCCSFLDHSVEIPAGKGDVWLHLGGKEQAREVLRTELQQLLHPDVPWRSPAGVLPKERNRGTMLGLTGVGVAGVVCCLAPSLLGASIVGLGLGWMFESLVAASVFLLAGALVWKYLRRFKKPTGCC